ncbi:hypothetical protein OAG32_04790, partial [Akkermansiaceae bacterium]|nr:hypothetical protein [Akkermansiaceae bacterium]
HAYIAEVSPVPGVADISPEEPIVVLLRDDKTTVNVESVKLSFNGVDITGQATVSSGNGRTTINYQPPPARQSDRNELLLEYMDSSGESFTREWSFANSLGEKPPMVTLKMTPAQSIWKDHIQDLFRRVGRSLLGGTIGMSRKAGLEKQMEIFTNWSRPAAMEETSKES